MVSFISVYFILLTPFFLTKITTCNNCSWTVTDGNITESQCVHIPSVFSKKILFKNLAKIQFTIFFQSAKSTFSGCLCGVDTIFQKLKIFKTEKMASKYVRHYFSWLCELRTFTNKTHLNALNVVPHIFYGISTVLKIFNFWNMIWITQRHTERMLFTDWRIL